MNQKPKCKTITFLEENIGVNLHDFRLVSDFLDIPQIPKVPVTKEKKLDFIKIMNFCSLKDTIQNVKNTTHTMGEYIYK